MRDLLQSFLPYKPRDLSSRVFSSVAPPRHQLFLGSSSPTCRDLILLGGGGNKKPYTWWPVELSQKGCVADSDWQSNKNNFYNNCVDRADNLCEKTTTRKWKIKWCHYIVKAILIVWYKREIRKALYSWHRVTSQGRCYKSRVYATGFLCARVSRQLIIIESGEPRQCSFVFAFAVFSPRLLYSH